MKSESLRYEDREIIKFICPSKKKKKKRNFKIEYSKNYIW